MPVLTAIDVLGVQRYVFSSNRLRDVVGASLLVERATSSASGHPLLLGCERSRWSEARPLLAAGGNALLVAPGDLPLARRFASHYSRLLHDSAPGLETVVVHREYGDGELARALRAFQVDVARAKAERRPSAPLLGLGVNAVCRETGLPATGFAPQDPGERLSRSILQMRARVVEARERWREEYLVSADGVDATFPLDLDHLGRTHGDSSLIGVVHIDLNGAGAAIRKWLDGRAKRKSPDELVEQEYKEWSGALSGLMRQALQAVVQRARGRVFPREKGGFELRGRVTDLDFALRDDPEVPDRVLLPLVPVLLGGDDLTFVCDGRIALDLAVTALRSVEAADPAPHLERLHACAGVAIVRAHSPFSRAYQLSEQLCQSAKEAVRQTGASGAALDWHIGQTRPRESPAEIRRRQYSTGGWELTARPYLLAAGSRPLDWEWLTGRLLGAGADGLRGPSWSGRGNKALALRDAVRRGPEVVRRTLAGWQVVDPGLRLPALLEAGFYGNRTPLLDAGELLDLYQVLEGPDEPTR